MFRDGSRVMTGGEAAALYLERLDELLEQQNNANARYGSFDTALHSSETGLGEFEEILQQTNAPEDLIEAHRAAERAVAGLRTVLDKYKRPSSFRT